MAVEEKYIKHNKEAYEVTHTLKVAFGTIAIYSVCLLVFDKESIKKYCDFSDKGFSSIYGSPWMAKIVGGLTSLMPVAAYLCGRKSAGNSIFPTQDDEPHQLSTLKQLSSGTLMVYGATLGMARMMGGDYRYSTMLSFVTAFTYSSYLTSSQLGVAVTAISERGLFSNIQSEQVSIDFEEENEQHNNQNNLP